jgi:hypothetical protein
MSPGRASRSVQLFSRRASGNTGSRGSGYLLADGFVLTARHVLAPAEWGPPPDPLDLIARPVSESQFEPAQLVWPATAQELADQEDCDIALVRLTNVPEALRADATQLGFGGVEDGEALFGPLVSVYCVGFPNFMGMGTSAGGRPRFDTYQMNGEVAPFTGEASKTLAIDWNKQRTRITQGKREDELDWYGFSGSGLLTFNRRLIGVVVTENKDQRFDFRAARIDPLLLRPDFVEALKGKATITGAADTTEAPLIEDLVHLLDRDDQEGDFVRAHRRASPPASSDEAAPGARPLLCLVPGAAEFRHLPDELLARFARETLPSRFDWPSRIAPRRLTWPSPYREPSESIADLRDTLWEALSRTGAAPEKPEIFRKVWQDIGQPRLYYSDLTQYPLTGATARVLGDWADFWSQLAPADRRPPTHLLLLGAASLPEARDWCAMASSAVTTLVTTLTELKMCTPLHLKSWFDEQVGIRLPPAHAGFLKRIRGQLEKDFKETFFLHDFKARVKDLTEGGFHV